ncbi:MAG: hypothetical protein Kow0069_12640 [Promethearchaeota archaeon]
MVVVAALALVATPPASPPSASEGWGGGVGLEYRAAVVQPNLTRSYAPIVLNNDSNPDIWDRLYNLSIPNIRVLYFSDANEWVEVPYQIDEKAYFRGFKYELGFAADGSLFSGLTNVDVANWGHFVSEHRYVGKHRDNATMGYSEPNLWESENTYYNVSRCAANGTDIEGDPDDNLNPISQADYLEHLDGNWKQQLEYRIDWDDELCFYAQNGKKASVYSWWNYQNFPYRLAVDIYDQVDGGRAWMYIYFNDDPIDLNNPPAHMYYVPAGAEDLVSWNKDTSEISGKTYKLKLNASNFDLEEGLTIKWPGLPQRSLWTSNYKQYLSIWFHIFYDVPVLADLDVNGQTEVWREGLWDEGYFDEQYSAIGFGMTMDLDLALVDEHSGLPGQDSSTTDSHRTVGFGGQTHTEPDDGLVILFTQAVAPDAADHDHVTSEITPFVRGMVDLSGASNEATIDGPVRVILDLLQVQVIFVTLTSPLGYEELWTIETKTLKYYANMHHADPTTLDLAMDAGAGMQVDIRPYFAFMFTRTFSDFVRNDPTAYVVLGDAPYNVPGIATSFTQRADPGDQPGWPLYLYPNGNPNDDDMVSGGNPQANHYDNTTLLPAAGLAPDPQETLPPAMNPLSDWFYLSTSAGGAWTYVPYQEWWQLFTYDFNDNRDLATYWRDASGTPTEIGLYGNQADQNGATGEYEMRTVFGNFTFWECQREYARMKYPLNKNVTVAEEVYPGGAIFEDTDVYVNGQLVTGAAWLENGDKIWIDCDMDAAYPTILWSINATMTDIGYTGFQVTELIPSTHVYRVELFVNDAGNFVPPLPGANVRVQVATTPVAYHDEPFYLDNADPTAPTTFSATANYAQVDLAWSGQADNGQVALQEIWRNGTRVKTFYDGTTSSWTDTNVVNGRTYEYFVRVIDQVGHYADSATDRATIALDFDPAQPATPPAYFPDNVTIDWSADPGDTTKIDNYRVWWGRDLNHDQQPDDGTWRNLGWLPMSTKSDNFRPLDDDGTPQNGTYVFKVESYDADNLVSINSSVVSSTYDDEVPDPGVIVDIPDEYYPETVEIQVQWSGEFDAFSGVAQFRLERDTGTSSAPDGTWSTLGTFGPSVHRYYDNDLVDGTWYWYRLRVTDGVGHYAYTSLEKVHYHEPVGGVANLRLDVVNTSLVAQQRGSSYTFNVNVKVKNTGTAAGTVNDVVLDFTHPTYGDVTFQYTIGGTPSFGSVAAGSSQVYTFTGVYAASGAYEGQITVDATLTWDSSNTDDGADSPGSILIRDFSVVSIDSVTAQSPVLQGSTMTVNATFSNPMSSDVNVTAYWIVVGADEGWTEGVEYAIESVVGPDVDPGGHLLSGGAWANATFYVAIAPGASTGVKWVDFYVSAEEVATGDNASASSIDATSFSCQAPDTTPPTISNPRALPATADPDAGDWVTISANVTDPSGIASASATVQNASGDVATLALYDDGTHGDAYAGDGCYTNRWNSSTAPNLGAYTVDFRATDGSPFANQRFVDDGASFTLVDVTAPSLSNPSAVPALRDPEVGGVIVINVDASDWSGLQSVTATVQYSNGTSVTTLTLYDDGAHDDGAAGDDTYGNSWACDGFPEDTYNVDYSATDASPNHNLASINDGATFSLVDQTAPSISGVTATSPLEYGAVQTITATITDFSGIAQAWATIENGAFVASVQLFDDGMHSDGGANDGTWGNTWNSLGYAEDTYNVDVNATDGSSQANFGSVNDGATFVLQDTTPPTILNSQVDSPSGTVGTMFTVTSDLSDLSGIAVAWLTVSNGSGWLAGVPMVDDGTGGDASAGDGKYTAQWDSTGFAPGTYDLSVNATDGSASSLTSSDPNFAAVTLTTEDLNPPSITNVQAVPDTANPGDVVVISATIVDDTGIFTPNVTITGGSWSGTFDLVPQGGNVWSYSWDTTGRSPDLYDVRINATDTSSNNNPASVFVADLVNLTLVDFKLPVIHEASDLPDGNVGDVYLVWANVTDDQGVASVVAYVQSPDGNTVATIPLTDSGGGNYTGAWDSTGYAIGTYWLDIRALDTSSNERYSDNYGGSFLLDDVAAPFLLDFWVNATTVEYGEWLLLVTNVSDPSGILDVMAYMQQGDENTVDTVQLFDDGPAGGHGDAVAGDGNYTATWHAVGFSLDANWEIDLRARDASSKQNALNADDVALFDLRDTTAPSFSNQNFPSGDVEYGGTATFTVTVTDLLGVDEVWVTLWRGATFVAGVQLFDDGLHGDGSPGDGVYSNSWSTTGHPLGTYAVDVNATDLSTNPAPNLGEVTGASTFNLVDTQPPDVASPDASPNAADVTQNFTVTVEVTDEAGVASVFATFTNATTGAWVAGVQLFDDGLHGDGLAGDGTYGGEWEPAGYPLGDYNVSVNATDSNANVANVANFETITLTGVAPTVEVSVESVVDVAYAGEDQVILVFGVRTDLDVNVTSVTLNFGDVGGSNNAWFAFNSLNVTLDYELVASGSFTYFTVAYDVLEVAPILDDGLAWFVHLDYVDLYGTPYVKDRLVTLGVGVKVYHVPAASSPVASVTGTSHEGTVYLDGTNAGAITFSVAGTRYAPRPSLYNATVDLTAWGLGVQIMTWDAGTGTYAYHLDVSLPAGAYDLSDVTARVNSNVAGLPYRYDEVTFSGTFAVDADRPVFDLAPLQLPAAVDPVEGGFQVVVEVKDDDAVLASGLASVTLQVVPSLLGPVQVDLVPLGNDLWGVMVDVDLLGEEAFAYADGNQHVALGDLVVTDIAGNVLTVSLSSYRVSIVDNSAPSLADLAALGFRLSDVLVTTPNATPVFPADQFVDLHVFVDDHGLFSSGLYWVRLYYVVLDGAQPSPAADYDDWDHVEMVPLGGGEYFCLLPRFAPGQTVRLKLVASDMAGNVAESPAVEVKFVPAADGRLWVSYVAIFGMAGVMTGSVAYRLAVRKRFKIVTRKKAKSKKAPGSAAASTSSTGSTSSNGGGQGA